MKKNLIIIGGGAAALFLANEIDANKFDVSIYEQNKALARKFLVAGDGGLNLTHSEPASKFVERYTPSDFIKPAFLKFSNTDFIAWLNAKGIATYQGSSGRIFPVKGLKPIQVLDVLQQHLLKRGVQLFFSHKWTGFSKNNDLVFSDGKEQKTITADIVVFCLGGASWPVTGSDGKWTDHFSSRGLKINTFQASNCSFNVNWPTDLIAKIEGKPLKNIKVTCDDISQLGEIVLTRSGLEGSGIYPCSPQIRKQLYDNKLAEVFIDFKPQLSEKQIREKLSSKDSKLTLTAKLSELLHLQPAQVHLLKSILSKEDFLNIDKLTKAIKHFSLTITGLGPLEDAISSVGGLDLGEISEHFELKKTPGFYAIGEMLDDDAPTGGYLLQSCFTMAMQVAAHLNNKN